MSKRIPLAVLTLGFPPRRRARALKSLNERLLSLTSSTPEAHQYMGMQPLGVGAGGAGAGGVEAGGEGGGGDLEQGLNAGGGGDGAAQ